METPKNTIILNKSYSYDDNIASTLAYLRNKYQALLIPLQLCAGEIGYCPQSARNAISRGSFPLKTFLIGNKRMVRAYDLAQLIVDPTRADDTKQNEPQNTANEVRGRGRPRKTSISGGSK